MVTRDVAETYVLWNFWSRIWPRSSLLSKRQLQMILVRKSLQEYPVIAGVPQGSIRGPTLFLLHINDFPDDFICNIAI